MSDNRLRALFAAGGTAVGGWCMTPSALNAELYATEGFDYVGVDCQHGLIGYEDMVRLLTAVARTDATPLVRVPFNDTAFIGRALDAGAEAVVVPMVNSAPEAERAAAACRYAPQGMRSFGPVRAGLFLNQAATSHVNQGVQCFVMIETIQAVEAADEICSTPGVDGVYVGPIDLALTMGVSFGYEELPASHAEAIEHVRATCAAKSIVAGIHTSGGENARHYLDAGFQMVTLSSDHVMFRHAARSHLALARGGDVVGGSGIYT